MKNVPTISFWGLISLLVCSVSFANFDWQGHRGARGLYPENTIGAMTVALNYPITTLELDVVISKDKLVVVSHDPFMHPDICLDPKGQEIRNKSVNLYKMTYEEIAQYDCGSKPVRKFPEQQKVKSHKPLLGELLSKTEEELKKRNRSEVRYNIEIKSDPQDEKEGFQPEYKEFSELVVAEIMKHLPVEKFSIQSFDWRVLRYLREKHPEIILVALKEGNFKASQVEKDLGFLPNIFSPHFSELNKDDVTFFHSRQVKVIPWTVNSTDHMRRVMELGVDGIITDYPNLIEKVGKKSCLDGYSLFEGKCRKIPKNAVYSDKNPGWICNPGFMQKRNDCKKIKLPKHAHFETDGKTWVCDEGYERYRGKCKKSQD